MSVRELLLIALIAGVVGFVVAFAGVSIFIGN